MFVFDTICHIIHVNDVTFHVIGTSSNDKSIANIRDFGDELLHLYHHEMNLDRLQ